jgi:hypothetical protein
MTTQTKKPQAVFPDLPRDPIAVESDGKHTEAWSLAFNALFQALQNNFSNEGYSTPPLTQDQMNTIASLYTSVIGSPLPQNSPGGTQQSLSDISGHIIFNSDNRSPNQFVITYDGSSPPNVSTAQWWQIGLLTTSAGDPNGIVGGGLFFFCWDTTNSKLYICTTAGSANGTPAPQAVWTII